MFKRIAITVLMLGLAACASEPPQPQVDFNREYDFKSVKTIAFYHGSGEASGSTSGQVWLNDMVHNRVDEALANALRGKGFEIIKDEKAADMLIAWHLSTEEKTDVRTYNTGMSYGYGPYGYRGYGCYNCGGTDVRVRQYTQGTFVVDMIDPEIKQAVWRSVVQSKLKGEASQNQGDYDVAALRIMAEFPPHMLAATPN